MGRTAQQCVTLREYREEVLRLRQWQVAERASVGQAWISQIENGHQPKAYNESRDSLLNAYQLRGQEEEFVRMIQNAKRLRALRTSLKDSCPLIFSAKSGDAAVVNGLHGLLQSGDSDALVVLEQVALQNGYLRRA